MAGRPAVNRTGKAFGLVRAVERQGSDSHGSALWLVRCEGVLPNGAVCGVERLVSGRSLDECPPSTHQGCKRAVSSRPAAATAAAR
jgi:hypothetical protein